MSLSKLEIAGRFASHFGSAPEVIAQAPGRINLIGEHVDYNDGFVLPFAIDAVTYCALSARNDGKITIVSEQQPDQRFSIEISQVEQKPDEIWSRYILGVIWSLGINGGLDIYIDGQVPLGAGLSSSAALECSVATALNHRFTLNRSIVQLARATQRAENDYVGVPCGIMDQSISLMGRSGFALLLDCRDLSTELVPVDFLNAGLRLLIIDTRAHHALVDGGYAARRASCEKATALLKIPSLRGAKAEDLPRFETLLDSETFHRIRHVVTEIERVRSAVDALRKKEFSVLGELINQSHDSLRDDYTVSCPELDAAVNAARGAGALGARMVGGGFGGSAIALIHEADLGKVSLAVERAFADAGFTAPRFFDAMPSDGAKIIS